MIQRAFSHIKGFARVSTYEWLTEWLGVKYAHTRDKLDLFINVTMVLPASACVGHRRRGLRGRRSNPSTPHRCQDRQNGKTAA